MTAGYLLGPVAREVRILTWRAVWWILEHVQECANYVYAYVLWALQELFWYLEEVAWAYGINLGGMFPNSYGTGGAFHGFAEGVVSDHRRGEGKLGKQRAAAAAPRTRSGGGGDGGVGGSGRTGVKTPARFACRPEPHLLARATLSCSIAP